MTARAAALQGATRYQETNASLAYTGYWQRSKGAANSGGALRYAVRAGASATVSFNGTSLTWVASTGPRNGKARVSLDGRAFVVVDQYSSKTRGQRAVYSTGTLASGPHTVRIEWTGQKNFLAKGNSVSIDAVYVKGSLTRASTARTAKVRPVTTTTVRLPTTTTAPATTTTTAPAPTTTTAPAATTTTTAPATTTTTAPATTTTTTAPAATTTTAPATTTTTVPPLSGAPFDLQAAIDAAGPGAIITIPAGTHTGPFRIAGKSGLTLQGPTEAILTVKGVDLLEIIDSSNIVLDGFTLVGDYSVLGQKCVKVSGLTGGAFRNLTIRDAGNTGIYSMGVFSGITISGCKITHCGDFGIHFQAGGDGVLIENCILSDFASVMYPGHGIYAKTSKNIVIRNCETSNVRHLTNNGDGGIQISYCTNTQVIDCYSYGNEKYGFIAEQCVATFIRCLGQNNGVSAFYECGAPGPSTYTDCTGSFSRYPS
jgi:hypothetical protein